VGGGGFYSAQDFAFCLYLIICLPSSCNLKMERVFSSETSVIVYRTTRRYDLEGETIFHSHRHEGYKLSILELIFLGTRLKFQPLKLISNQEKISPEKKQTPWLESAGANYTDQATTACRRS
jgi:hypothetical protein